MQDARVPLRQHENYGLRTESGVETPPDTHPLNTFHNIFKPLWRCADMHKERVCIPLSLFFSKQPLNKGWSCRPMLSYK